MSLYQHHDLCMLSGCCFRPAIHAASSVHSKPHYVKQDGKKMFDFQLFIKKKVYLKV